jgi:AcrR family transcriptional regulator
LDAAIACLNERGYTGTTTSEIAERAGVSRGAQVHHFHHKGELVIGALDRICELRLARISEVVGQLPPGTPVSRLEMLIDVMWVGFQHPAFYAWLELVVASRTDPMLRIAMRRISRRLGIGFKNAFVTFMSDQIVSPGRAEAIQSVVEVIFGTLQSMAIERALMEPDQPDPPRLVESIADLKQIVRKLLEPNLLS